MMAQVRPFLEKALEKGGARDWSMYDIEQAIYAGRVQLWAVVSEHLIGAAVTTVTSYPKRKVLEVLLFGSEAHTEDIWQDALQELSSIAREDFGADSMTWTGRPGWSKLPGVETRHIFELRL